MTPYFLLNWHNRCFHNTWVSRLCKAACTTCICLSSILSSEFWVSTIICVLHFFSSFTFYSQFEFGCRPVSNEFLDQLDDVWRLMKLYTWRQERKIYIETLENILRWKFAAFFSHIDAYRCVLRIKIAKCTKHSSGHMRLVALWH